MLSAARHNDATPTIEAVDLESHSGSPLLLDRAQPSANAQARLLFVPGLGIPARHYHRMALGLAGEGIDTWILELRGTGRHPLRAARDCDWGYRELLLEDIAGASSAIGHDLPCWIGGHSLGAQLACLHASTQPDRHAGLSLVASGVPYWRDYAGRGWMLRTVFALIPALTRTLGYFPGHRLGFAGREAARLVRQWSRTGISGRYAFDDIETDFEAAMARLDRPVIALRFCEDWLAPKASLARLIGKLGTQHRHVHELDTQGLGVRADHFAWMKSPAVVVDRIASSMRELAGATAGVTPAVADRPGAGTGPT